MLSCITAFLPVNFILLTQNKYPIFKTEHHGIKNLISLKKSR